MSSYPKPVLFFPPSLPGFALTAILLLTFLCLSAPAQTPAQTGTQTDNQTGSSSSNDATPGATVSKEPENKPPPRLAQPEAGGSAITLETSEPLFDIAAGLNVCGYDADLAASSPVRWKIRDELNAAAASSATARTSRDALCRYVHDHTLADERLNLAQYISLALYLSPAPELTPTVGETELPPDATQVVNILPLLRAFATEVNLHQIWIEHRPDYEALLARVHDPITKMILDTNIYLGLPVSSYDGRRFLVLLEPMLAPAATNARIYSSDYIVVASPAAQPPGAVHMNDIRHTYLHYEVEPLVYARASAMARLQPLLKSVQDAPLEFVYKSEIVPLITECLIKAIEAQTMDVGIAKPQRPAGAKARLDLERFDAEMTAYQHQAEAVRRKAIDLDLRQGWVLAAYFYDQIGDMERQSISLKEDIGQMVYGMDVDHEAHLARQIAFLPPASSQGSADFVRRSPRRLTGLQLAEKDIFEGNAAAAAEIARKVLSDPSGDHAQAHYVLARVNLMQSQPGAAIGDFQQVLTTSKDPRTLAWSHIYLGRLYDVNQERDKALGEYRAALTVPSPQPDTKAAAEVGLKQPFTAPKARRQVPDPDSDNAPLDPSGKAEKEAYRPPPPSPPQ